MSVEQRIKVEQKIVRKLFKVAGDNGLSIYSVHDGDEHNYNLSQKDALDLCFDLDEARVYFKDAANKTWGVYLVFGNDGWDVVCDNHIAPEGHPFKLTMDVIDEYSDTFA